MSYHQRAKQEIKNRYARMQQEQLDFLEKNEKLYQDNSDISGAELSKKVRAKLKQDETFINDFTEKMNEARKAKKIIFNYTVWSHKFPLIFKGTQELFGDDENVICQIASGKVPKNHQKLRDELKTIPRLDSSTDITSALVYWGTSKPTYLTTAILTIYFVLSGKNINDLSLDSSIVHVAPLNKGLYLNLKCSYAYNNQEVYGFAYPHSGYAYGGPRYQQSMYPKGKEFTPHDCSSFIAEIINYKSKYFNTKDLYQSYYDNNHRLRKSFVPVTEINQVTSGMVVSLHSVDRKKGWDNKKGHDGHMGFVDKIDMKNNTMDILNYNREMPAREGAGVTEYKLKFFDKQLGYEPKEKSKVLFYSPKLMV
jgi:hypothetical protein